MRTNVTATTVRDTNMLRAIPNEVPIASLARTSTKRVRLWSILRDW